VIWIIHWYRKQFTITCTCNYQKECFFVWFIHEGEVTLLGNYFWNVTGWVRIEPKIKLLQSDYPNFLLCSILVLIFFFFLFKITSLCNISVPVLKQHTSRFILIFMKIFEFYLKKVTKECNLNVADTNYNPRK
jgi:hypothetical protein